MCVRVSVRWFVCVAGRHDTELTARRRRPQALLDFSNAARAAGSPPERPPPEAADGATWSGDHAVGEDDTALAEHLRVIMLRGLRDNNGYILASSRSETSVR